MFLIYVSFAHRTAGGFSSDCAKLVCVCLCLCVSFGICTKSYFVSFALRMLWLCGMKAKSTLLCVIFGCCWLLDDDDGVLKPSVRDCVRAAVFFCVLRRQRRQLISCTCICCVYTAGRNCSCDLLHVAHASSLNALV